MESTNVNPEMPEKPIDEINDQSVPEATAPVAEMNSSEEVKSVEESAPISEPVEAVKEEIVEEVAAPAAAVNAEVPADEEVHHLQAIEVHPEELEVIAEPAENFGQMSKEELLARMEVFSKENDVNVVKNRAQAARDAFQLIYNQEMETALASYLEAGGIREDFEYKDPIEEKFFEAYKVFQKRRSDFILGQEKIRQENLKAKNEILQQMKNILQQEEDMSKAFNEFHDLQAKWRSVGPVPPQNVNDLWMTYKLYSDRFYEFIKINRELQDLEMKKNLEMKMHLCERAEEMLLEPSLNKALQEIQSLQHKWREIGAVPREKRTEVWVRFKATVDKIFENKRTYLDSQREVFEGNLAGKTALCEKAEALVNGVYEKHPQWQEGLKQLLELQAEWRKIGPAGKDHNESIWQRFKGICDQFFKNKDAFYKKKKQEYASNLQLKTELCIQAEALKESEDWKSTSNELVRLQQEWKKIGPAGEKNEKIWQRFKAACDAFFARKNEHFKDQDKVQDENLKLKNELIETVEKYVMAEDPNESLDQLKAFQRQFTETGLVPRANKDDIQLRFRNAIPVHFDALKSKPEYRQAFRQKMERPERAERSERSERPQRHSSTEHHGGGNDEQRTILSQVTKLNSEVQVLENNIGFFAKSKNASALLQEYEQKINAAKEEINALKAKLKDLRNA
jgi:hypothetical protein